MTRPETRPERGPVIHHLSCATMCPPARHLRGAVPQRLVAHCLLVEGPGGLILVDTGLGTADVAQGARRVGRAFAWGVGARFDADEPAVRQVRRLGHDPADVRDVVVTHLDVDHAGGLPDFPTARVHVHRTELQAALHPSLRERTRYVQAHWAHGPRWVEHAEDGDTWFGFTGIHSITDDVLLVPLHGHTRGHCGVAVRQGDGSWLLHAGDAYFHAGDLTTPRQCPPGLRLFQAAMAVDGQRRRENLERLRDLARRSEVTVVCAHDESELLSCRENRPD